MIRRSPCENYLKYLVSHPHGYDNRRIRNICVLQQLDFVDEYYLDRLRKKVVPPVPFYPHDDMHERSQRFLMKHRIWKLYYPDPDMEAATALLEQPKAKEHIEMMLLGHATPTWIASALRRTGVKATAESVKLFKYYYWNTDLVDTTELKVLLLVRGASEIQEEGRNPLETSAYQALTIKAGRTDPRLLAVESQLPAMTTMMNMLRMGFMPSNVELSRIASATRIAANVQAFSSSLRGAFGDSERSRDYAQVVKTMTEVLDAVGSPEEDLTHQLTTLLQTDKSEMPTIKQLGGSYTVDVQPTAAPEVIDVESE